MKITKKAVKTKVKKSKVAKVVDEVFEKLKKQDADNMKVNIDAIEELARPKDAHLPDMVKCDDCGKEIEKHYEAQKCDDCYMILCPICLSIHREEHLKDMYEEEEEEEERTNKPQWQ